MAQRPLTYVTEHGLLQVDSCRPQRRAMAAGKIRCRALTHGHYPGQRLPPLVLPGLSTVGHLDARGEQDWGLEPHRNEGIEISLLETGHMDFSVDGREHRLSAGDVTITRPWQLHCLGNPHINAGRFHWLILDVGVRRPRQSWTWPAWIMLSTAEKRELAATLRHTEQRVWKGTPDLQQAFREVAQCVDRYAADHPVTRLTLSVNRLLLSLLEALRGQNAHDSLQANQQRAVESFLQELRDHQPWATRPWTMAKMAAHCGMGTTKFSKLCREVSNTSPWDYLIDCRLQGAARELRESPRMSVTQVALSSGFSTSQYFATCFRKRFHCSPREYRAHGSSRG